MSRGTHHGTGNIIISNFNIVLVYAVDPVSNRGTSSDIGDCIGSIFPDLIALVIISIRIDLIIESCNIYRRIAGGECIAVELVI